MSGLTVVITFDHLLSLQLKQGYLYKKSTKTLNRDWKKKYVTLTTDGRLTYHSTLHDYMEDVHGKNIPLKHTTVKIPGQKPRGSRTTQPIASPHSYDISSDLNDLSLGKLNDNVYNGSKLLLTSVIRCERHRT